MAFNSTAADEIRNRIRQKFKQANFENARTFHSLASNSCNLKKIFYMTTKEDVSTRKMTLFIQQLMKPEIKNPVFIEKMYEFFRKEKREIERAGFTLDDDSYFDYRRNMLQVALGGEKVKSKGEKIIADYLFEHDISYKYEKVWLWGSQIYRPDFSIYDQQSDFVIEHWGIDEFDPKKSVPKEWDQTWDEYYAEMQAKRSFWAGKEEPAILIETSIRDLYGGREVFEKILEERLAKAGISRQNFRAGADPKNKGPRLHDYEIGWLFTQFIQKAKKQMLKAKDVQDLLQTYQPKDEP
jgi:DNA helicase-4